jgi:RimJ/RimL family protein N-acetyltransferase
MAASDGLAYWVGFQRATCSTAYDNLAMQAVAECIGFQRVT